MLTAVCIFDTLMPLFRFNYMSGIENADRNISLETLEKIIVALDVAPIEVFRFHGHRFGQEIAAYSSKKSTLMEKRPVIRARITARILA